MPSSKSPCRLLVEGADDKNTIIHLLKRHDFNWDEDRIFIQEAGGITQLLDDLPVLLKGPFDRIGIMADADESLPNSWARLRDRAARAELDIPKTPVDKGTILPGFRPGSQIGIWLMPDNSSPGSLENFLEKLVPEDDPTWPWADEAARVARRRGARFKEIDHPKSRLHTWLAWQERPGIPFGIALQAQVFRHDTEDALRFVAWFKRLFVDA
jgi:hypothetical protein